MPESTARSNAVRSVWYITLILIGTKALGFVKQMMLAATFATDDAMDAFNMAQGVTLMLTYLITCYVGTIYIPMYKDAHGKGGQPAADRFTSNAMSVVTLATAILVFVSMLAAPLLVRLAAPGFDGEKFTLTVALFRICFIGLFFAPNVSLTGASLEARGRFVIPKLSGLVLSVCTVAACLLAGGPDGVYWLAFLAGIAAVIIQLGLNWSSIYKSGYRYQPTLDLRDPYIRQSLVMAIPVFIGTAANELSGLVDKMVGSSMPNGSISALTYADSLVAFGAAVIVTPLSTVLYPRLCEQSASGDREGLLSSMWGGLMLMLTLSVPVVIAAMLGSSDLVRIAFERGVFTPNDTAVTSKALFFQIMMLPGFALSTMFSRAFYALQDTRLPMLCGFVTVGVNIVGDLLFPMWLGIGGITLATSAAALAGGVCMAVCMKKKLGRIGMRGKITEFLKLTLSAAVFTAALWLCRSAGLTGVKYIFAALPVSLLCFFACGLIIKMEALHTIKILRRR